MLYSHRLQAMLRHLQADVYLDTTPFLPPFYTGLTRTPVVATCYDLIPLIFPRDYFLESAEFSVTFWRLVTCAHSRRATVR